MLRSIPAASLWLLLSACASNPALGPGDGNGTAPPDAVHDAGGNGGGHDAGGSTGTPPPHEAGPSQGGATTTAPYHVQGAQILDRNNQPHLFRGLDRPSLEWSCSGDIVETDYITMAQTWKANVVRLPLNQDCWLQDASNPSADSSYQALVDEQVQWAKTYNMDIILDLHWSDQGNYSVGQTCLTANGNCQQDMADAHSVTFWDQVAAKYKNEPQVLFELYNEPKIGGYSPQPGNWDTWLNGGQSSGFTVHGMQELYTHVRNAGANNLVIVGGLSWSFDLSGLSSHALNGTNIVYNTHPYKTDSEDQWFSKFGTFAGTYPIIATEFGDSTGTCSAVTVTDFTSYANGNAVGGSSAPANKLSWTAWAFYAPSPPQNPCTLPALISGDGTPTAAGLVVQKALTNGL